jgi:2-polyprenyl-3-methyl-5-hydroxy-6-metoxy-1,4-benzoquinol methylase
MQHDLEHHVRDYNKECQDCCGHKYAYNFDRVLRGYMVQTFRPFCSSDGKALELGCYKGDYTELLAEEFADLTVVEASDELLGTTRARVRGGVHFINSTFEALELPAQYDAIFLVHTLEHIDDPVAVLSRICGWLAPGGRLFVAVPNANAASRLIAAEMGVVEYATAITPGERAQGHRCTYSFDTLQRDIAAAGLKTVTRGGVFFKPLANFQFDRLLGTDILSQEYLDGCFALGLRYPDLCASIYAVCERC